MKFRPLRLIRYTVLRLARLREDPVTLARGFGLGIFIGVLPLLPVQTMILVPLTLLLRVNTVTALIAASAVSNPLTFAPQYYYTWKVGNMVFPDQIRWDQVRQVMTTIDHEGLWDGIMTLSHLGGSMIMVLLTGGAIIGLPLAAAGYVLSLNLFIALRKKRMARHRLN